MPTQQKKIQKIWACPLGGRAIRSSTTPLGLRGSYLLLSLTRPAAVLMLIISSYISQAQQIQTFADSTHITIGNPFTYQIQIIPTSPKTIIQWPTLPDTFSHFEVLQRNPIDTTLSNNQTTYTQAYTLTSFDSGLWYLPTTNIYCKPTNNTEPYTLQTTAIPITVNTVVVDTTKALKPIASIIEVPKSYTQLLILIGIILAVSLLLCYLGYVYYKRQKAKPIPVAPAIVISPQQQALTQLQALQQAPLNTQQNYKDYYSQLTHIVRTFLHAQYSIPTLELTTPEIMKNINNNPNTQANSAQWQQILNLADYVKFAKALPSSQQAQEHISNTIHIISQTPNNTTSQL